MSVLNRSWASATFAICSALNDTVTVPEAESSGVRRAWPFALIDLAATAGEGVSAAAALARSGRGQEDGARTARRRHAIPGPVGVPNGVAMARTLADRLTESRRRSFVGRQGQKMSGTCFKPQAGGQGKPAGQSEKPLACRPDRGGPGAEGKGPPPDGANGAGGKPPG